MSDRLCQYQLVDGVWKCQQCTDERREFTHRLCSHAGVHRVDRTKPSAVPIDSHVGYILASIIAGLGMKPQHGCKCNTMIRRMNHWGVSGCRANRAKIVAHLRSAYKAASYVELAKAAGKAVTTGLAFRINPLDPIGSIIDEAIRLAEAAG